ncbi:MAG: histidine kinase [Clostridiales bacterium]|nr:histidine kinase [Clostridiales bacterium]
MKRTRSLRRRLLFLVVIIWMMPVLSIYYFLTVSYRNSIIEKTTVLMEEELKNFTSINAGRIEEAIDLSKKTSYEQVIEKAWRKYIDKDISKSELYREIIGNLKSKFYNDNRFIISVFYLSDEPDHIYYTSRKASDYIEIYKNEVEAKAHSITKEDTSDAHVSIINGKIYIIRNLYTTTNYTKFGTLILELNKDKLIDGISLNTNYELGFFINDTNSVIPFDTNLLQEDRKDIMDQLTKHYAKDVNRKIIHEKVSPFAGVIYQQKYDDFHFGGILVANENIIFSELRNLYTVIFLIVLIIIPVFIYMLYFISHHITKPMSRMIQAAQGIEKGGIGLQIEGEPMPNTEFAVLMESFNHMSSKIKYLFDTVYQEKIARKDAKILALQSQINPHFLNNTLEMMNWQARMAGDTTVSKMIEALGTLLNSSMSRSNRKMIPLSEELRCVDAYCYIISMRFGKRLKIEKEIDESLLQMMVPRLILQPLIENAVVHGVEKVKSGMIKIKVFREADQVILQIINTGKEMTQEDIHRVEDIIQGKYPSAETGSDSHKSMGIHNVNERIRLIYGENYGLVIKPYREGETASTITLPIMKNMDN